LINKIIVNSCPWCNSTEQEDWGNKLRGFKSVICLECGLIFVKNRLSDNALVELMSTYLSDTHQANLELNSARFEMYKMELDLVNSFINDSGDILDVGCSGGYFLDEASKKGFNTFGVELGEMAAKEAGKRHNVWQGFYPDYRLKNTFDLIVFRGVLQYTPNPKNYINKAINSLNENGILMISQTPNGGSFCANLFKEQFNQHCPEDHLMHFSVHHFDNYLKKYGLIKLIEKYPYEETPYYRPQDDIKIVSRAMDFIKKGKKINFRSPPFWGNMMTLVYQLKDKQ
jgi:2-polyprenyl-3-methyl-5-hydroxy-6-metoxy-1,4-benzoquinol methylase